MIYRIDNFTDNILKTLSDTFSVEDSLLLSVCTDNDYSVLSGSFIASLYHIMVNKQHHSDWRMAVGDFVSFCEDNKLNGVLVLSEDEFNDVLSYYSGHRYNDPFLRDDEPRYLVHSTTYDNYLHILGAGSLMSWNKLKLKNPDFEDKPVGRMFGDPCHFSDYVMLGSGVSCEIVVKTKQSDKFDMDIDSEYLTGARLYFDAKKMAEDGLLIRDGAHLKVKDELPLKPYLLYAATWEKIGLTSQISTPRIFSEVSDRAFDDFLEHIY